MNNVNRLEEALAKLEVQNRVAKIENGKLFISPSDDMWIEVSKESLEFILNF